MARNLNGEAGLRRFPQFLTDDSAQSFRRVNRLSGRQPTMNRQLTTDSRQALKRELMLEVLRSFGETRLRVTGTSMLPAVWPGDVLTIRRDGIEAVRAADIVLVRRGSRLVAHRLVEKIHSQGEVLLVTRGDRLMTLDPPTVADDLLGRVSAIERNHRLVSPRLTLAGRLSAWLLRWSDFAARLLLYMHRAVGSQPSAVGKQRQVWLKADG